MQKTLELTAEQLRHVTAAFTKAGEGARSTMKYTGSPVLTVIDAMVGRSVSSLNPWLLALFWRPSGP